MPTENKSDIPDEPFVLSNLLLEYRMGLESIAGVLYDKTEEECEGIAEIVEDASAAVEVARDMCRRRGL